MIKSIKTNKDFFFRLGLGAIFLANSVAAWVSADEFRDILTGNSLASRFGHADSLVHLIGVNDGLLFLLILSGRYRKLAVVWGSLWMAGVIYLSGFWTTDFVEHIGVLALLVYYGLNTKSR